MGCLGYITFTLLLVAATVCPGGHAAGSCADKKCGRKERCAMQAVMCIRAPCPSLPVCVPMSDPPVKSCDKTCGRNERCALQAVMCIRAPCPSLPVCVPNSDPRMKSCGKCKNNCVLPTGGGSGRCGKKAACGPVCMIYCRYGNVMDDAGCPTCKCKKGPTPSKCSLMKCAKGTRCVERSGSASCVPACGSVCRIYCRYGNVMDDSGCPTCKCKKGPTPTRCSLMRCAKGTRCVERFGSARCVRQPPSKCSMVRCAKGTRCVERFGSARCVRRTSSKCSLMKCAKGYYCFERFGSARCVRRTPSKCSLMRCAKGTRCVERFGSARCVRRTPSKCSLVRCAKGTRCVEKFGSARCVRCAQPKCRSCRGGEHRVPTYHKNGCPTCGICLPKLKLQMRGKK